jgi:pimeloyl-ACP methyl ester carboxylesterase
LDRKRLFKQLLYYFCVLFDQSLPKLTTENFFLQVLDKRLHVQHIRPNESPTNSHPKLLFLHEGLGCIRLWKDFPARIVAATGCEAIVYERQGYGLSDTLDLPRPDNYLDIEASIYLPELLQQLKIENPIMVGHSDGGTIALQYAAKYPVRGIVGLAPHIKVEDITVAGIEEARERSADITPKLLKYHGDKTEAIFWAWPDTWLRPSYKQWNIASILPEVNCPVLIIQGEQDEFATPEHAIEIATKVTGKADFIFLENCAHVPHVQAKEKTLEYSIDFILKILQTTNQKEIQLTK